MNLICAITKLSSYRLRRAINPLAFVLLGCGSIACSDSDKLVSLSDLDASADAMVRKDGTVDATIMDVSLSETDTTPTDAPQQDAVDLSENIYDNYEWLDKISPEHPRMFFNEATFKDVKARALGKEKKLFDEIRRQIDAIANGPLSFENPDVIYGDDASDHKLGIQAAQAAFVYLVTNETRYFDKAKALLQKVVEYYEYRNKKKLNISWYSYSRLHALMAYDWLFNSLTKADRDTIGTGLFDALEFMLPVSEGPNADQNDRPSFPRENRKGTNSGFYNNQSLAWYMGLAFYRAGIRDERAEWYLTRGYDRHNEVLEYRNKAAGDDGGSASVTLTYVFGAYPWAEFNFFHTFQSATGGYNIAARWPYVANLVNYLWWNILPRMHEYGIGDAHHVANSISKTRTHLNLHLAHIIHFYAKEYPTQARAAKWLIDNKYNLDLNPSFFPLARFFISDHDTIIPKDPAPRQPHTRYFEGMGQFFMRSGSGYNDTYAMFTVGNRLPQHNHYDNNHFVIYKNGFSCLDSGTRNNADIHLSHYYARTVAHNCITIRKEGEVFPRYWNDVPNDKTPVPNDGGQSNLQPTKVIAFRESKNYSYIASDAASSYKDEKTKLVLRQFVFLPPDNFVIFDRVNATDASYPKTWLLHTATKPVESNKEEFYVNYKSFEKARFEQGQFVCKTIFPLQFTRTLVGGPGKQFWSDGRNWPLRTDAVPDDSHPVYGQWRVEIKPKTQRKDDVFLHLIQVGSKSTTTTTIASAQRIDQTGMKGVSFTYQNKQYRLVFRTTGEAGGRISIVSNGTTIVNEAFTNLVQKQSAVY